MRLCRFQRGVYLQAPAAADSAAEPGIEPRDDSG